MATNTKAYRNTYARMWKARQKFALAKARCDAGLDVHSGMTSKEHVYLSMIEKWLREAQHEAVTHTDRRMVLRNFDDLIAEASEARRLQRETGTPEFLQALDDLAFEAYDARKAVQNEAD